MGEDNVEKIKELLDSSEVAFTKKKRADSFAIQLRLDDAKRAEAIKDYLNYHGQRMSDYRNNHKQEISVQPVSAYERSASVRRHKNDANLR